MFVKRVSKFKPENIGVNIHINRLRWKHAFCKRRYLGGLVKGQGGNKEKILIVKTIVPPELPIKLGGEHE
jgi:hypothetical protein